MIWGAKGVKKIFRKTCHSQYKAFQALNFVETCTCKLTFTYKTTRIHLTTVFFASNIGVFCTPLHVKLILPWGMKNHFVQTHGSDLHANFTGTKFQDEPKLPLVHRNWIVLLFFHGHLGKFYAPLVNYLSTHEVKVLKTLVAFEPPE